MSREPHRLSYESSKRLLVTALVVIDAAVLMVAMWLAAYIRFAISILCLLT